MEEKNTRTRIFNAASDLFSSRGFEKVSVREICEAANVKKPVLYYYFKDKDTLLEELVEETFAVADRIKSSLISDEDDFLLNINKILDIYKVFINDYPSLMRFSAFINTMTLPNHIIEKKKERFSEEMNQIKNFLLSGKNAGYIPHKTNIDALAASIFGSIIFWIVQYMLLGMEKEVLFKKLDSLFEFWKTHYFLEKETMEK